MLTALPLGSHCLACLLELITGFGWVEEIGVMGPLTGGRLTAHFLWKGKLIGHV